MKKVLVEVHTGRLFDIVAAGAEFPVAQGLVWADAPDNVSHEGFHYQGGSVVPKPPRPLNEVRDEKLAELQRSRKQAIDTLPPVQVAGKLYPATPEYREVITGIARRQAAARPVPATLRGVDGTPATLNAALINQIDDAITGAVQAAWDNYWARFEAVQAATTVEQVNAITW